MTCDINPHVLRYIEQIEDGSIVACEEQKLLAAHVRRCFEDEDIHTNDEQLERFLALVKYFPYESLFDWEAFCFALHNCTFRADGMPRWPDLFLLMGRGGGKDGYIAFEAFCLTTKIHGIQMYHVDICANNEEQAKEPFNDIHSVLETEPQSKSLKRSFYWNKEEIVNLKTKSKIKFRTNSPKGKDGLRSGIVILNEIHQYQDYANINVFTTGLGKKRHPRRTFATTNGDVRDGPLDHMLERAESILHGREPDAGMLPFVCKLDTREEVHDSQKWGKANPSLRYRPDLLEQITKEYTEWSRAPSQFTAFMTKRMNIPDGNRDLQVTSWENILATKRDVPNLKGRNAVVGVDYASMSDFASAGFLLKYGDERYWISHSWVCAQSRDLTRIKAPWRTWAAEGLLTVVDDVEINPDLITEWIAEMAQDYGIVKLALDNFRYALMTRSLQVIGFDAKEAKNIKLVRPSDIMKISPVIESAFSRQQIVWGDNPLMRWYTNNTKMIRTGINAKTGNMTYGKIEEKSRKTDGFMAFVAAMTIEDQLDGMNAGADLDLPVFTF